MFCRVCGRSMSDSDLFCTWCGTKVLNRRGVSEESNTGENGEAPVSQNINAEENAPEKSEVISAEENSIPVNESDSTLKNENVSMPDANGSEQIYESNSTAVSREYAQASKPLGNSINGEVQFSQPDAVQGLTGAQREKAQVPPPPVKFGEEIPINQEVRDNKKPEKYYTSGHIVMCLAAVGIMAIVAGVFAGLYFSVVI